MGFSFLSWSQFYFWKGESEFFIHSLGSAIPRALNLALQIQKDNSTCVNLETVTSTLELTDDYESTANLDNNRHNSAVHIKIVVSQQQETSKKISQQEQ